MSDAHLFQDQVRRLRSRDHQAAAEIVRTHGPEIQLEVRLWLRRQRACLRRAFDSGDICQKVLDSFFRRVADGQYDLNQPEQLIALLMAMARNKFAEQVKHHQRQRRDIRRVETMGPEHRELHATGESLSEIVAGEELLAEFRKRLTADERRLAELRSEGWKWSAIAAELGGTSERCRKQLERAIHRIGLELRLEGLPAF